MADIWTIEGFVRLAAGSGNTGYIIGEVCVRLAELERTTEEYRAANGQIGPPFETVEELEAVLDEYFTDAETNGKPITLSGLSYVMNWSRESIKTFDLKSHPMFAVVEKARRKCREYAERYLYEGKNQVGAIFLMKANWGVMDAQRIEHIGEGGGPLLLINRQPRQITGGEVVDAELEDDDPLAL